MQKIKRIAYEIYENNLSEKCIVLAGVSDNGFVLASLISQQLQDIDDALDIEIVKISIDKTNPSKSEIQLSAEVSFVKKAIVLLDDVLNTGKTIAFTMKTFLSTNVKKIEVGVLVNRSHKQFPIYPKYVGYEMATTFNEHVEVQLKKGMGVYLY